MNWVLTKILGTIGKRLDGYKTKIGGIGSILLGIIGLIHLLFPDQKGLPEMTFEASIGFIVGGIAAIGIGDKSEKQKIATIEQTQVIQDQNIILAAQITGNRSIKSKALDVAKVYTDKLNDNPSGISLEKTPDMG